VKTKPKQFNFSQRGIFLFTLFFLVANSILAQVRIAKEQWVSPNYPVNPPDKNPMFFKSESYQGASKVIYPYALNDMISNSSLFVGMGYKALGENGKTKENLEQAVGLPVSNLWAAVELGGL